MNQPRFRDVIAIVIYCPCTIDSVRALAAGQADALDRDPAVAAMLGAIRASPLLGNFGLYRGVVEIGFGLESFVPGPDAAPTLGTPDTPAWSPTASLTVHVDASLGEEAIADALTPILAAHPWEIPVVEWRSARIAMR